MIALLLAAAAGAHAGHTEPSSHAGHDSFTYWMVRAELEAGRTNEDADILEWNAEAWIGGDRSKVWLKSEGEAHDGDLETAEVQALYSEPISDFFDIQLGVRYDIEPEGRAYLVAGVEGLAPYFFETEAALFLSDEGDVSLRLEQDIDLLLTQSLILTPSVELEAYAQDVPELGIGAGLADAELKLTLRYEITKKFAPYVALTYQRRLGETASIARASGEDNEETALRAGLRVWF